MSATLYLRLNDHGDASWVVRGPETHQSMRHGALEQAAPQASGLRLVVLVPAVHILLTEAKLPSKNPRRLRQAVPYAVEEQLSDDVEASHFALGAKRTADGALPVAVVSRGRMEGWKAQIEEAGMHAASMVPESLALPLSPDEWTLLLEDGNALLRTAPARGYALDPESLEVMLSLAFEQADDNKPARLRLFNCRGDEGADTPVLAACAAAQVEVVEEACDEGSMEVFAGALTTPAEIDLLQGDFSRREHLSKLWRPWRATAALLGVWLLLQMVLGIYHYVTLSRESTRLQAEIEAVYRQAFPEARNVSNPRLQMEHHLSQLQGGTGGGAFVTLMAQAAPVLNDTQGLDLGAIRYKDGVLDVQLTVGNFQAMDRLKQALSGRGMVVEIQNASARGGKTQGLLRLQEGK